MLQREWFSTNKALRVWVDGVWFENGKLMSGLDFRVATIDFSNSDAFLHVTRDDAGELLASEPRDKILKTKLLLWELGGETWRSAIDNTQLCDPFPWVLHGRMRADFCRCWSWEGWI
jgi:hypothetical protein